MRREYVWRCIMKRFIKTMEHRMKFNRKQLILCGLLVFIGLILSLVLLFHKGAYLWEDRENIAVTAHRGASFAAPENTLSSLRLAIDAGADYAEIDVQETKDGVAVLLHDYSLKRTTGKKQYIWNVTYEELKRLDCGKWFSKKFAGERVPTLEEALEVCRGKIGLNIELKDPANAEKLEEKVVRLIEEYGMEEECVITSMDYESLCLVKELNGHLKTGYILSRVHKNMYETENIDFFSMKAAFVNQEVIKMAHCHGKEVHVWTVNTPKELKRMKKLGVDNIITDNPVLARKIIEQ